MQMRVFIFTFSYFATILGGKCLCPGPLGMDALMSPLCFEEIPWLHVQRRGVCGYGYIQGYPRKNLWIWIWIWMGNFISTASLE